MQRPHRQRRALRAMGTLQSRMFRVLMSTPTRDRIVKPGTGPGCSKTPATLSQVSRMRVPSTVYPTDESRSDAELVEFCLCL